MSIIASFDKFKNERQDYDIDFTNWLRTWGDSISSFNVAADTGITIASSSLAGSVVKVWVADGVNGSSYNITATVTTAAGRIKQATITIKVR